MLLLLYSGRLPPHLAHYVIYLCKVDTVSTRVQSKILDIVLLHIVPYAPITRLRALLPLQPLVARRDANGGTDWRCLLVSRSQIA